MNILVLDCDRVGLDFCLRAADAGHNVRWHRYSKRPTKDGLGFRQIQIIDDWRPSMKWASNGLILLTGNARFLPELERFRDFGLPIFGPSVASAELEIKRSVGMEAMRKAGLSVPPYKEFKSLEDAEAFARKSDKAWVFKTMGDNEDKSLSFVAHDPAELVGWLEQKIDAGVKLKGPCILQEKIDMLAELGVSGWFGPDGFLPDKWQYCFEHKKLYDGDLGPNVGEQGTVCSYTKTDKLAEQLLMPLVPQLKKLDHRGDFAVGCGVDTKGNAHFFEFSARCGWPEFYLQTAAHKDDPAQWMKDLLDGHDTLKVSYDPTIGVVLSQPPYPEEGKPEQVEGNIISGVDDELEHLHLAGVMLGKGPVMKDGKIADETTYKTSSEYVMIATALGKTISAARENVYGTIGNVHFANMAYRTDIGKRLQKCLPKLCEFGYCEGLKYGGDEE